MEDRLKHFSDVIMSFDKNLIELFQLYNVYFVGGAVRDIINGKDKVVDVDIVAIEPNDLLKALKHQFKVSIIPLDLDFGVYRVYFHEKEIYIDISKMQGNDIYEDIERRDFTINSIALKWDGSKFILVDPLNGLEDLKNKLIRVSKRKNLIDDPLRIIRAFRFHAELGFNIDDRTMQYIEELSFLIDEVSEERIKYELARIFNAPHAVTTISKMYDTGVIQNIFPFLRAFKGFSSGKRHIYDLWSHSLKTLENIENLVNTRKFHFDIEESLLNKELEKDYTVLTAWKIATLFHDVGKLFAFDEINGKVTFYKHEIYGSQYLHDILTRKKLSKNTIDVVFRLVRYHMYPFHIAMSKQNINITPKIYLKLKKELGDLVPIIFNLFFADLISTSNDNETKKLIEIAKKIYNQYEEFTRKDRELKRFLNGNEIMEILGLKEGPEIGRILHVLREAELSGNVASKDDAVRFVKKLYENKNF
jgi:poly(A) polymerase